MELSLFRTSISNTPYKTANDAIYRAIDLMEHEYTGPDDHTRMVQIIDTEHGDKGAIVLTLHFVSEKDIWKHCTTARYMSEPRNKNPVLADFCKDGDLRAGLKTNLERAERILRQTAFEDGYMRGMMENRSIPSVPARDNPDRRGKYE